MRTIESQVGTVILSLEAGRLYGEPTRICNVPKHATGHGCAPVPQRYWPRKSELCLPWLLASRALEGASVAYGLPAGVLAAGPVQPSYSPLSHCAGRAGASSSFPANVAGHGSA